MVYSIYVRNFSKGVRKSTRASLASGLPLPLDNRIVILYYLVAAGVMEVEELADILKDPPLINELYRYGSEKDYVGRTKCSFYYKDKLMSRMLASFALAGWIILIRREY
jgi:hypothetical protein